MEEQGLSFGTYGSLPLLMVRVLLEEERYNVTGGNHLCSSHAAIATVQPDLVILDLVWGEQTGWDLLEALAQDAATATTPIWTPMEVNVREVRKSWARSSISGKSSGTGGGTAPLSSATQTRRNGYHRIAGTVPGGSTVFQLARTEVESKGAPGLFQTTSSQRPSGSSRLKP